MSEQKFIIVASISTAYNLLGRGVIKSIHPRKDGKCEVFPINGEDKKDFVEKMKSFHVNPCNAAEFIDLISAPKEDSRKEEPRTSPLKGARVSFSGYVKGSPHL